MTPPPDDPRIAEAEYVRGLVASLNELAWEAGENPRFDWHQYLLVASTLTKRAEKLLDALAAAEHAKAEAEARAENAERQINIVSAKVFYEMQAALEARIRALEQQLSEAQRP